MNQYPDNPNSTYVQIFFIVFKVKGIIRSTVLLVDSQSNKRQSTEYFEHRIFKKHYHLSDQCLWSNKNKFPNAWLYINSFAKHSSMKKKKENCFLIQMKNIEVKRYSEPLNYESTCPHIPLPPLTDSKGPSQELRLIR